MAELTSKRALGELERDHRFLELDRFVPPLQIIRAMGFEHHEVAHSRLIANLLDPSQHRGAETVLRALLQGIPHQEHLAGSTAELLEEILRTSWTNVSVEREFRRIDIVVQITSSHHQVVVGIENKIDAGEGHEQLGRYQAALEDAFSNQTPILVFLTPTGREPTTADSESQIPTVSADYNLILEAVDVALRKAEPGSGDQHALQVIAKHVREDILGEETEVKSVVRELWRTHGKALRLAMEHRPRLEDIRSLYEALLHERFGDDADTYYWRSKGELREIKMGLASWWDAGCPFEFILHVDDEGLPLVRLLVWHESYDENAVFLRKWARDVSASNPDLVDEEFTLVRNWGGWRRVLVEPDHPASAILDERAFDGATAKAAVEAVVRLYEKLQPHIKTT